MSSLNFTSNITSVGYYAFAECKGLTDVVISEGITNFGYYAFYYCTNLTNVELPNTMQDICAGMFWGCSSIKDITIPESVTSIDDNAFSECTGLKSLTIPNGVTYIGSYAFSGCRGLTELNIPEQVTYIGDSAFKGSEINKLISIDETLELPTIFKRVQNENDILYSTTGFEYINCIIENDQIKVNDGQQSASIKVLDGALNGLVYTIYYDTWDISKDEENIVTANLSEDGTLTIAGNGEMSAYKYGTVPWENIKYKINSIKIKEGITKIQNGIFSYCENLTTVEIPSSVTAIENNPFTDCINLKEIKIDNNNNYYKFENGIIYSKDGKELVIYLASNDESEYIIPEGITSIGNSAFATCRNLKSIIIPESVTNIEDAAFEFCSSLESIEIPKGVTIINDSIFAYCSNLISVKIPNTVTSMGMSVFFVCNSLENIEIPNSVTSIQTSTFYDCINLKKLVLSDKITYIGENAFYGCNDLTITCKKDSVAEKYAKENGIKTITDEESPQITFFGDWTSNAGKKKGTYVTETDSISGINEDSLRYLWTTQSENVTKEEIINTYSKDEYLEIKDVTGVYYLWVYAEDKVGNGTIKRSDEYLLDNSAPVAEIEYSTLEPTNGNVVVMIKTDERIEEVDGWNLFSDGAGIVKTYSQNTAETGEDITIKDFLGHETTVNIKVTNIDRIAPFLNVKADVKSTSITVETEATDKESGISEDSYIISIRKENEEFGEQIDGTETYTFTNLESETKYIIGVEVWDKAGNSSIFETEFTTQKSDKITSTIQKVDEEKLTIKEIKTKTTVEDLKKTLQNVMEYKIQDQKGNIVLENAKIGTGFKIKMENEKTYTLIVKGDINGDGDATIRDILAINKHRLKKTTLVDEYLEASDVNEDGKLDIKDILRINKFRLGKISEL